MGPLPHTHEEERLERAREPVIEVASSHVTRAATTRRAPEGFVPRGFFDGHGASRSRLIPTREATVCSRPHECTGGHTRIA
jgi:hypothetical protein